MLRDVFYYGKKPNAHPREKFATDLADARKQCTTKHFWIINEYCDYRSFDWDFDFEFLPDEDVWAENHNNVWPSYHQKDSGTWLCSKEHSNIIIYRADVDPIKRKNEISKHWVFIDKVDIEKFDFSWHPDPTDPPYIYIWGNKWIPVEIKNTLEYHVPGATNTKYMGTVEVLPFMDRWKELIPVDKSKFDFTWRPHPYDPPYIYVFGNQWYDVSLEPTLEYHAPGSTDKKYITDIVAHTKPDMDNWVITYQVADFDYSWRPHPYDPPMIYQFGTLLDDIHLKDGPVYNAPNNDGTIVYLDNKLATKSKVVYPKYYIDNTLDELIEQHPNEIFWALRKNINYDNFDFSWTPTKENVIHINVFGSPDSETTQTYFVNSEMISRGFKSLNFIENKSLDDEYLATLFKPIDVFFVDKSNKESSERFEQLKQRFPNIQKTRYLNTWVDTINRCLNKCTTELCWILNSELDYTNFDFGYYPNPWQMKMVHMFGTQWSHWGTTFIVNKETFAEDTKHIKIIEHLSNINFVKKSKARITSCLHDIYFIDHGNDESSLLFEELKQRSLNVNYIKYDTDYLKTFKTLIENIPIRKDHYIWVCSSICKYDNFDFTYICDPFSFEQFHVFPSDRQKYGDTFFVNVNKLRTLINKLSKLDDLEKINFNATLRPTRLPCPTFVNDSDTHTDFVKFEHNFPYAIFVTEDNQNLNIKDDEPISLWSEESKNIVVTSEGASRVVIPKEAASYVKKELYDYPYIITPNKLKQSNPLDIVFLSNGEKGADENYEHLLNATKGLPNRVVRVDGVNGRVAAYHAAAEASNTNWMFTVFAKLKVDAEFDWNWQPDRMQVPKHYIFYATNPVNGLRYGHQAMIAYNKKLTLANTGSGLDFTLDNEHEVVRINSGVAVFNTDEWSTWRTAFREALKLKHDISNISKYRLMQWTSKAEGDFAQYSLDGANHAVEYYEEVNGDIDKLKLSYDWPWLRAYFDSKYK